MDASDLYLRSTERPCACLEYWKSHHPECPVLPAPMAKRWVPVSDHRCACLEYWREHHNDCAMDLVHQYAIDMDDKERELETVHETWATEAMAHEDKIKALLGALRDLLECGWIPLEAETGEKRLSREEAAALMAEDREFVVWVCIPCGDQTHNPDPAHHALHPEQPCPLAVAARLLANE